MGLFTNNKKLCPICGNPTPRLLATKVEDVPLCKECAAKIDLPDGALDQMTLDQLGKYMDFYAENEALQQTFKESYRFGFGLLSGALLMDGEHRLLRLKPYDRSLVFEASALKSFRITEDGRPLFEARDGVLYCHYSDVPDRVTAMQPAIDRFYMDVHDYERMEEMDRRMHRDDDDHRPVRFRPTFDMKEPVEKFAVELTLAHPYWHSFREEIGAPDFDSYNPSAAEYLNEYEDDVNGLHELAAALLHIMDASGTEQWDEDPYAASASAASADSASVAAAAAAAAVAAVQQSAAPVDTVAEIQKYKALLDAGVLTEEEFAAKKKQLLGI